MSHRSHVRLVSASRPGLPPANRKTVDLRPPLSSLDVEEFRGEGWIRRLPSPNHAGLIRDPSGLRVEFDPHTVIEGAVGVGVQVRWFGTLLQRRGVAHAERIVVCGTGPSGQVCRAAKRGAGPVPVNNRANAAVNLERLKARFAPTHRKPGH